MSNLFNFDTLFSNSDNSNKLPKNMVNKKFDEFIKETFGNYLYKSAILNNYAKVYEGDTDFSDECKELYILSEELYLNAVKKIKIPFDVKFKTSKDVYIFNLNDIHNDDFIYKNNADQRIIRPKKQQYLCKIIAINFVKLYILIKGIYSTFNHNLNHEELTAKKKKLQNQDMDIVRDLDEEVEVKEIVHDLDEQVEVKEIAQLGKNTNDENNIKQLGGGLFDDFRNLFTGNSNEKTENNETEEAYEEELGNEPMDDNNDDDEDNHDKPRKKIKYNNIFYAFINAIFESDIAETETNLNMEFPASLDKFTKNLHVSGVFDILCDTDYIYSTLKKNILFNPNNMNKVYKTSPIILQKIKNFETDLLKPYNSNLKSKDDELKKILEEFKKYNKLCKKLTNNFSTNDKTRVYEQIIKIVKSMFTNYTSNRNKLFNETILNIFEFNEKIIKDIDGAVTGVQNNIIRIKDNITYKEIIKLTSNSKIIIYDLHIGFFKDILRIFDLLNEKNLIVSENVKSHEPKIQVEPEVEPIKEEPEPGVESEPEVEPIKEEPEPEVEPIKEEPEPEVEPIKEEPEPEVEPIKEEDIKEDHIEDEDIKEEHIEEVKPEAEVDNTVSRRKSPIGGKNSRKNINGKITNNKKSKKN
jgi:hypothetical protein